jgi:ABC-type transport system involved in multi-copper enzyme maturation permease subunit
MSTPAARTPVLAIAANTCTEAIRQPIHAILLLIGIGLLAVNPLVSAFTLGDDDLLLLELALSTVFVCGMFLAAFTAALSLGEEIRRHTVLAVLAKPVSRPALLLGKFIGIAVALASAWWIWGLALLLSLRHGAQMRPTDPADGPVLALGLGALILALALAFLENWRRRRSFSARLVRHLLTIGTAATIAALSLDPGWRWQGPAADLDGNVLGATLLLLEAMLLLGAAALAASTRLGTMATLASTGAVFVVGMIGGSVAGSSPLRHVLPNLQLLWVSDGLLRGGELTAEVLVAQTLWCAVYTGAILALAVALFRTRDVG